MMREPTTYTVTYEGHHTLTITAHSINFEGKWVKFYDGLGFFQQAIRAKKVLSITTKG